MQLQILLVLTNFVSGANINWSCPVCTYANVNRMNCEICNTQNPNEELMNKTDLDEDTALKNAIEKSMRESSDFANTNVLNYSNTENPQSAIFVPILSPQNVMEKFVHTASYDLRQSSKIDYDTKTSKKRSSIEKVPSYGVKILDQFDQLNKDGKISHVILVDLDNWGCFFKRIPGMLPEGTFVSGYHNGTTFKTISHGKPFAAYNDLIKKGMLEIKVCSRRKDAADFNICIRAGQLDILIGVHIPISVLSGDHGFEQIKDSGTRHEFYVVDPKCSDDDITYAKLVSIGEQNSINK